FFFSSRRRHTRSYGDWSSDVCSSDLETGAPARRLRGRVAAHTVEQRGEEAIGERVRVAAGPEPGVGPVGGREEEERRGRDVEVRSEERRVGKEGRCRWSG